MDENDVIRCIVNQRGPGGVVQGVHYYGCGADMSDEDGIEDLIEHLVNAYSEIVGFQDGLHTYETVSIKNITANVDLGEFDWTGTSAGGAAGEHAPTGCAALITFPTSVPKRRGRKFLGGLSEAHISEGLLDSGMQAAMEAFAAFFLSAFLGSASGLGWLPGVLASTGAFSPFTAAIVSNIVSYQRRRKPGIGS